MNIIIITGINGFVGKHLTRELKKYNHSVIGIGMEPEAHPEIRELLDGYYNEDLSIGWPKIQDASAIIHLAGLAAVGPSFDNPQKYININSSIVTNMCEYYLKQDKKPRIVMVSSGAIYDSNVKMPITELSPIAYTSPYTVSKILLENQAAYYTSRGIECVVMRPFNHVGPGQLPGFLVPDLAQKIRARSSNNEPIKVGNLKTKRDYTDVRDVVRAYRLVATKEGKLDYPVYNVCSGVSHDGEKVLDAIVSVMDIERPLIEVDEKFLRPNDTMDIRGDNSRLVTELGWKPTIPFEQTITDFVKSL
ncbi:NAD-dependent epimerase/dehydratase family protein [Candidatus Saccharibacteria bacterium]|nr:NAD-dependent epimerase/dehydratase family protein [Candidatus Saccharibacteria bacterium]